MESVVTVLSGLGVALFFVLMGLALVAVLGSTLISLVGEIVEGLRRRSRSKVASDGSGRLPR